MGMKSTSRNTRYGVLGEAAPTVMVDGSNVIKMGGEEGEGRW